MATALLVARFNFICIFGLHRALDRINMWKLFAYEKIFAHGKIKSSRKSFAKKEKTGPKRKERVPLCQEKKKSLVKATGTRGALHWCPDFEQ